MKLNFKESLAIVYSDLDILVINKPAGLITESQKDSDFTLEKVLKEEYKIRLPRSGIVHRLDRDTSGVMVVAKTEKALVSLQSQFASHEVEKTYYALVYGKIEPKKGTIDIALKRDPKNRVRFVASKSKDAKPAITHYEIIGYKKFPISNFQFPINDSNSNDKKNILSLLKINLETGRTHQIRAHFYAIGYPVIGDPVYKTKESEDFSKKMGLKGQVLHAGKLCFKHPATGKKVCFEAEIPETFAKIK